MSAPKPPRVVWIAFDEEGLPRWVATDEDTASLVGPAWTVHRYVLADPKPRPRAKKERWA